MIVILLLVLVIIIEAPSYISDFKPSYEAVSSDWKQYLTTFGIFIFAYNGIGSFHQMTNNLGNPTASRLKRVSNATGSVLFGFYLVSASIAYFSVGQALVSDKVDLYPNRPTLAGSSDVMMKVIKFGIIVSIFVCYLNNLIPLKDQMVSIFNMDYSRRTNWIMSVSFTFLPGILAWVYPEVNDWFSILGSFCGGFIIVFFPGMMYYADNR